MDKRTMKKAKSLSKKLTRVKREILIIRERLLKVSGKIKEGDFVIGDGSDIYKVGKFSVDKGYKKEYQHRAELLHKYSEEKEWSHYGNIDIGEFESGRYVKIDIEKEEDFKEYEYKILKEAIKFKEKKEGDNVEESSERALAVLNKDFLVKQKQDVEDIKRKHQILARILDRKRRELQSYVGEMSEKIEKMNKVIGQIELYLGINEDIIQIQKGSCSEIKEPISLRQQMLYMDEETGALLDSGGLDYKSITEFDDWVTKDKNYEKLLPEKKGVVVLRVRRESKDYGTGNAMLEGFKNEGNFYTYLLIRNGDNLYRIWANIIIKERLFPTQEEMDEMFEGKKQDFFRQRDTEKMVFSYRQNLLLLQGLIDRTQVFRPFNVKINLFKPKSYGDYIKFIRDDEPSLTEGQLTFENWKKELNSKIERGTRIYFCGFNYHDTESYNEHSRYSSHRFPHYVSSTPKKGIYNIKRIEGKDEYMGSKLVCHYNPKDDIWGRWGDDDRERKQSIPFYLYRGDWCILNYDLITIKDIDYFINSRFDRGNYLEMLPVLYGIKQRRLKEIEWEIGFVDRLTREFKCKKELVWRCVVWWKAKVIWKRPIMSDDAKALRMIRGRIKRQIKEGKKQ